MAQNQTGGANRRVWSMLPLTRATHFGTGLSRSQVVSKSSVLRSAADAARRGDGIGGMSWDGRAVGSARKNIEAAQGSL